MPPYADHLRRLALLCPTRGRPDRATEFVTSAFQTAAHPERLRCYLYVDEDDPCEDEYQTRLTAAVDRPDAVSLTVGPAFGVPRAINYLADASDADVLLVSNDDQVYVEAGWDVRLDEEANRFADGIYCMWFNDGWESENFCTFPILGRGWYEALGYLQSPLFEHFHTDSWIWMLAKSIDRAHYVKDVHVEHRHWKTGHGEMDDTYRRNMKEHPVMGTRQQRDRQVIDQFERYFMSDLEALKAAMIEEGS